MALVELLLTPLPAHVRTARLVGVAAARRAGLDDEHIDEFRLALGEACSRAVGLNARHAPAELVRVTIGAEAGGLVLTVSDLGPAAGPVPEDLTEELLDEADSDEDELVDPDVALAVLTGLVDGVEVTPSSAGTVVTMRWPLPPGAAPGATAVSRS